MNLPECRIPAVLLLRGTRNFGSKYQAMLPYFENVGSSISEAVEEFSGRLRKNLGEFLTEQVKVDLERRRQAGEPAQLKD